MKLCLALLSIWKTTCAWLQELIYLPGWCLWRQYFNIMSFPHDATFCIMRPIMTLMNQSLTYYFIIVGNLNWAREHWSNLASGQWGKIMYVCLCKLWVSAVHLYNDKIIRQYTIVLLFYYKRIISCCFFFFKKRFLAPVAFNVVRQECGFWKRDKTCCKGQQVRTRTRDGHINNYSPNMWHTLYPCDIAVPNRSILCLIFHLLVKH